MTTEYELMRAINLSKTGGMYSGDMDSEPATQGNAMDIMKFILKHDISVEGYKLVKKVHRRKQQ